jgi:hypothetical protein
MGQKLKIIIADPGVKNQKHHPLEFKYFNPETVSKLSEK